MINRDLPRTISVRVLGTMSQHRQLAAIPEMTSPEKRESLGRWPRTFVIPSFSHQPFPALVAHLRFMGESCCKANSILLLISVPISWEWQVLPGLCPGPDPSRPQRGALCKTPRRRQLALGTGLALGEAASVLLWGGAFCWGYGGNSDLRAVVWVTMRGAFPMPDCPMLCLHRGAVGPCAGQWGWASTGRGF